MCVAVVSSVSIIITVRALGRVDISPFSCRFERSEKSKVGNRLAYNDFRFLTAVRNDRIDLLFGHKVLFIQPDVSRT